MQIASGVEATDLVINSASQIVLNQITKVYQAKDPVMQRYLTKVQALEVELGEQGIIVKYQKIPR